MHPEGVATGLVAWHFMPLIAVGLMQLTLLIPPDRSLPWHCVQVMVDTAATFLCVLPQSAWCLPLLSTTGVSLLLPPLQAVMAKSIAAVAEILISLFRIYYLLLSVTGYAAFVVGSAVAAIATGWVKFAFNLVKCRKITSMRHLPVGAVTVFNGWFHLGLIGVAIGAK
jgi:hypothetical protein